MNHHEAIAPFLVREGDCWVIATLHRSELGGNRAVKSVTEVRIDGAKVGVLTPKMSSETLPAVDFLAEQGAVAAVRARVKGNRIKGRGRLILLPRPRNIRRLVQQPCQRAERLVAIPRRRGRAGRWQHTAGCERREGEPVRLRQPRPPRHRCPHQTGTPIPASRASGGTGTERRGRRMSRRCGVLGPAG